MRGCRYKHRFQPLLRGKMSDLLLLLHPTDAIIISQCHFTRYIHDNVIVYYVPELVVVFDQLIFIYLKNFTNNIISSDSIPLVHLPSTVPILVWFLYVHIRVEYKMCSFITIILPTKQCVVLHINRFVD